MTRLPVMALTMAVMLGGWAARASAEENALCTQRETLLQSLAKDYTEVPTSMGLTNEGNVVEVLTAKDGMTWTILLSRPDGTSCVVAAGEDWRNRPRIALGSEL